jgi:hypothetical protein
MSIDFQALDFSQTTIITKYRDLTRAGKRGSILVPTVCATAYLDNLDTQIRQVVKIEVSVDPHAGNALRQHRRHKFAEYTLAQLHGFCAETNKWGGEAHITGHRFDLDDKEFTYQQVHDVLVQIVSIAESDSFKRYDSGMTYYRI